MIKRILFFVFSLLISFSALGSLAYAQEEEEQSLAVAIENIEIKTNGGKMEISAILFNADLKTETERTAKAMTKRVKPSKYFLIIR